MKLISTLIIMLVVIVPNYCVAAQKPTDDNEVVLERLIELEKEIECLKVQLVATAESSDNVPPDDPLSATVIENDVSIEQSTKETNRTDISWKRAPQLSTASGWSVKARGRLLYDVGSLSSVPNTIDIPGEGFTSEARRVRLGIQGDIPGGFGYKLEIDYASGSEITDAYLTYEHGAVEYTIGQHKPFQGVLELTSSNDNSFIERTAFTDAFNFEQRVGASVTYKVNDIQVQGGFFTDNLDVLDDGNNARSIDVRLTYAPNINDTKYHFGVSAHARRLGDSIDDVRYRQRPLLHSVDTRFVSTENIDDTTNENNYGLEAALIHGQFHAIAEAHWVSVERVGLADPMFFGASLEAGYFLTNDKRVYKQGVFKGVKVNQPLGAGGIGAWQVNVKFDHLDLVDAGVVGGSQDAFLASLIWTPVNHVRFLMNYGRLSYSDVVNIVDGAPDDFTVDVLGLRAQLSF